MDESNGSKLDESNGSKLDCASGAVVQLVKLEEKTDVAVEIKKSTALLRSEESSMDVDCEDGDTTKSAEDRKTSLGEKLHDSVNENKELDGKTDTNGKQRIRRKVSLDINHYVDNSESEEETTESDAMSSSEESETMSPERTKSSINKIGEEWVGEKRQRTDNANSHDLDGQLRRRSKKLDTSSSEEAEKEVGEKRKRKSLLHMQLLSEDEDESQKKRIKSRNRRSTNSDGTRVVRKRGPRSVFKPNMSIHELRRTRAIFIQYGRCSDFKKGPKCLECKANGETKVPVEKCRFYGFRQLKVTPKSTVSVGFCDPNEDPREDDLHLWRPTEIPVVTPKDIETSKFIIEFVGDQFCDLVEEENKTLSLSDGKPISWKRVVKRVREMCDVCATTLFNYQWTCEKCGFVACSDCYYARLANKAKPYESHDENLDEYLWTRCINNKMNSHNLEEMLLTQVIVGNDLNDLHKLFHEVLHEWNMPQTLGCEESAKYPSEEPKPEIKPSAAIGAVAPDSDETSDDEVCDQDLLELFTPSKVVAPVVATPSEPNAAVNIETKPPINKEKRYFACRPVSLYKMLTETMSQYPKIPHSWLCSGKLLRLLDPSCPDNLTLFQEVWKCGQPVLVSKVDAKLNPLLWSPQSFSADFGRMKAIFVNCMNGKLVVNQAMKVFWDGFEIVPNRLEDEQGNAMLLKLKDWPEKADFKDVLPTRFADIMAALPLQDYTSREGRYNLTSDLPDKFIRPDLGPKMYVAYGSGLHLDKGTTNLHLDISDAVNVMVYVGEPQDTLENTEKHRQAVKKAILDSDCDSSTIKRVLDGTDIPGALWHIYEARDADKIRNFLIENKILQGFRPNERHDPIHDQSCYLDRKLRKALMKKYNISGYPIIQCAGDAIFIPAGAPHQVRNLQNCIKVAEDFVSPENVHQCFHLTEEFRKLTEQHSNHEDKLQIKNIVYHSIKDSVSNLHFAKKNPSLVVERAPEIQEVVSEQGKQTESVENKNGVEEKKDEKDVKKTGEDDIMKIDEKNNEIVASKNGGEDIIIIDKDKDEKMMKIVVDGDIKDAENCKSKSKEIVEIVLT